MLKIKFGKITPAPTKPKGYFLRCVFSGNSIIQGQLLLYDTDGVIEMSQHQQTTRDVIAEGDRRCGADGMLVTYTEIEGVTIRKEPKIPQNGQVSPAPDPQDD